MKNSCVIIILNKNGEIFVRILHTADWHLGCKTDDLDRLEEQKNALKQVCTIAKERNVDMVIIAGDIYDSIIPSSDAEDLFYKTIIDLNNDGNTAIVAIAGNHDEPKRMSNANVFSHNFGIYLVGSTDSNKIKTGDNGKNIFATVYGKGFIKFQTRAGEKAVVAYLPYPSYYRYKETRKEGDDFNEKVKEWLKPGVSAFEDDTINILAAHIMACDLKLKKEELELYTTLANNTNTVSIDAISTKAHYTALGHVHKCMPVSREKNIYYSGSLINQFFNAGENDTKVILVDLDKTGVKRIEKIPLNVKKLKKFTGTSLLQAELFCKDNPDDLIKAEVVKVDRISIDEIKRVRETYPNLVTLSIITKEALTNHEVASKKDIPIDELFDNFCIRKTGKPADEDVKELFLELMSEEENEAD